MKYICSIVCGMVYLLTVVSTGAGQRPPSLPISAQTFRQYQRAKVNVPKGRYLLLSDVILRFYSNSSVPTSYCIREAAKLLADPNFDVSKPTVVYAHGYVEYTTDESVVTVVRAYLQHKGFNIVAVDWANLGFGIYFAVAMDCKVVGYEIGRALATMLKGGLSVDGLHLVGHSMGVHVLGFAARHLKKEGYLVPRLTGLDPAFPGFYPPLLSMPVTPEDAEFVDIIHTDGGKYGAPDRTGHVDFWPNGGSAKQSGCPSPSLPLSSEDFCSHWRSWAYWAESVVGGKFTARKCDGYDTFLRGNCSDELVVEMGLPAKSELRGNFYLLTAAEQPYALGERGAL